MRRSLPLVAAAIALAACTDVVAPPAPTMRPSLDGLTAAQDMFARYVALGTSNSMGVQSAGVFAAGQRAAWPAQLGGRVGAPFSLPLIQDPGCGPPLLAPLAADLVLLGAFSALGAGGDLVSAVMNFCMPLQAGIALPTNNVAISGAKARDALYTTPEMAASTSARKGQLYSRVLPPGQTQVTAMLAQKPTFVSVELAANEVLPASTGRAAAMTPVGQWQPVYDQIVAAVKSTRARAVLVGLPSDARNFPSVRRARELFSQWPYLLALGIAVSSSCYWSSNYLFIPGYLLTLLSRVPTTATCADVPGAVDYVLTPSDMNAINAQMAQMNAHIQAQASENRYAYFGLGALYDLPKGRFSVLDVLFSDAPFGPYLSLDGVHPSAQGQAILAAAAAQAIDARYGLVIP
jgi:hypothetical protein